MKIARLPDGRILVSDLSSARAQCPDDRDSDGTQAVRVLAMTGAEFTRLVDLGVNMELQAPECVFIEG